MKHFIAILAVAMLLLFGCAGSQPGTQVPPAGSGGVSGGRGGTGGSPSGGNVGGGTPPAQGNAKEFTIEASQWKFEPSEITVDKGDNVRITLVDKDVAHGIAIPDFGFTLVANAGQNATGEFTASKEGNYTFFCNVFCGSGHRDMKGTLIVK